MPTEVRASHILVPTRDACVDLKSQIAKGSSFADLAKQHSSCPSGKKGGDLGFFGRGRMVPEFDKAAFALPVNQVSEPIQTQFGWHLLVVTDQR